MSIPRSTERMLDIHAFEAGHIDPADFDHAAHVYVAWLYLQQTSLAEAIARFTAALRQLTARAGADARYHETITWFFLIVIAERCAATPGAERFPRKGLRSSRHG